MLVFPQLNQYPVMKRRVLRTVVNRMADGRTVRLADAGGGTMEWRLGYRELNDEEIQILLDFFQTAEGTLRSFTFVDPTANLLTRDAWVTGPMLTKTTSLDVWHLVNSGAGAQSIMQTVSGPAGFLYCFSASVRAEQDCRVALRAGSGRSEFTAGPEWRRVTISGRPDDLTFGLELPAGASADVKETQVEAQAGASAYRDMASGGVYEDARFQEDSLEIVTTGPNRHACTVKIIHADHI